MATGRPLEAGPERVGGVMESGLGGPDGDTETVGNLGQGEADVVVEDEDGPLLDREPPEGPVELIAVVDGGDLARLPLTGHGQESDLGRPATATPGLGVALVGQDPVQPGFEAIGVAQCAQLPPGHDQRGLHRIIGTVGVPQDPERDRHAPVADHARQGVEGLSVAPLRLVDECSLH